MHPPSLQSVLTVLAVSLAAALMLGGCGKKEVPTRSAGPDSPRACWQRLHEAIVAKDHGRFYDLLSSRDHAALTADVERLRGLKDEERSAAAEKLKLPADRLADLSTRDYFIALCEAASASSPANRYASAKLDHIEQKEETAVLFLQAADGQELGKIPVVRETLTAEAAGGQTHAWFLAIYSR